MACLIISPLDHIGFLETKENVVHNNGNYFRSKNEVTQGSQNEVA
jgi:hypothetical protein